MFPIDPSFREKKVLPQRGSRKYWFSSASYATIEPRGQKRPKPDCGIATLMKSLTTISTIIVRSGQSPIAGLQQVSLTAFCAYFRLSEAAKARLRDCNFTEIVGAEARS